MAIVKLKLIHHHPFKIIEIESEIVQKKHYHYSNPNNDKHDLKTLSKKNLSFYILSKLKFVKKILTSFLG